MYKRQAFTDNNARFCGVDDNFYSVRCSFDFDLGNTLSLIHICTMRAGAKGIKTSVSGRLGGADMARTEFYSEGTTVSYTHLDVYKRQVFI